MSATTDKGDLIIAQLRTFIKERLLHDREDIVLEADTSLIESGLIDSLGLFSLISYIEDTFAVEIPPEKIILEHFETLEALKQLVTAR